MNWKLSLVTFLLAFFAIFSIPNSLSAQGLDFYSRIDDVKEYVGKQFPIVKGDAKSLSIAAASIIAKVTRDRFMKDLASTYPDYCFEKHKGYGTKAHIEVIKDKGAIEGVHRKVFLRKILDEPKEEQLTILG